MRMSSDFRRLRSERGISMFLVIMAMFVTSMFVAAGFAAANGDIHLSGQTKDRKSAYSAAEAGLNFYLTHLNQDSDYWTYCENVPKATPTEAAPVNQPWNGVGADPRIWRTIPGSTAVYTLELLPAKGTKCDPNDQTSMIDLATGMFRIRATGAVSKAAADAGDRRSIVANFRRAGFLDFLYFTFYEDLDPAALSTDTARTNARDNCGGRYRSSRLAASKCTEIQFVTGDEVRGPMHSNDSLLICNQPKFGRSTNNKADRIEVTQPNNPLVAAPGCTQSAVMQGVFKNPVNPMSPPASNDALRVIAQNGGYLFTGKTFIKLNGTTMDVTTTAPDGTRTFTSGMPWPGNGVIYVQSGSGSCTQEYPTDIKYADEDSCANVYVSGTYSDSLTIASYNDVVFAPTDGKVLKFGDSTYPFNLSYTAGTNAVLGLIANNFVRVGHPVNASCDNTTSMYDGKGVTIKAAILSIDHSFIVDNYDCGNQLGNLNVYGAIAQRYRGAVGTSGGTGFLKSYDYDDRLKYRSPPHFLSPVDSAWSIVRANEQVPGN
jgi:hypothetical protein